MCFQPGLQHLARLKRPNTGVECLRRRDEAERGKIIDRLPIGLVVDIRASRGVP